MVVLDLAKQTKPALYMCLLSSFFSPGIYLWPMQEQAKDLGSDLATRECNEDRTTVTFFSITWKHSRGSRLVIPWSFLEMEQTATPPQYLWLHDQNTTEGAPCELIFAMTNPEQSSMRTTRAAGKGRRPQRSTGEIWRTQQKYFILFSSSLASWN